MKFQLLLQEKSLVQLDTKRHVVLDLIEKGKVILANPDKPKFLEKHVKQIEEGKIYIFNQSSMM